MARRRLGWSTSFFLLLVLVPPGLHAQSADGEGFWARWFERSEKAKSEQPHWLTPNAMTTPRLEQEFRYDVDWAQARPGGVYTENYGNTKGLELIPLDRVEVIFGIPGYVVHNNPAVPNGWSDAQFLVKYRLLAANEQHGNYILTAFISESFTTGTNRNGQLESIVTPTLAYGKGWGDFDMQGTIGVAEPVAKTSTIGRTYTWNHTFQVHVLTKVWPELEVNQSWFSGGKNDGKEQTLLTPGVVVGRTRLTDRLGLTVGAGVQIAVSKFHTNNHNIIASVRFPF